VQGDDMKEPGLRIIENLYEHVEHETHIFPDTTQYACVLTAGDANTWTSWVEIADENSVTLSSKFASKRGHITAMLVEESDQANTRFVVEITYGASKVIVSTHRVQTEDKKYPTDQVTRERGAEIPAGETVYYRAMCETAGGKTINVHFRYFLHP